MPAPFGSGGKKQVGKNDRKTDQDIAGGKILELNAFSPGGIHSLREIYRMDVAQTIVRDLERRVRLRDAYRGTRDPEAAGVV